MKYYVYVLRSKLDSMFYVGYTHKLQSRLDDHIKGRVKSTTKRRPLDLVYYEVSFNKYDALHREKYLKTSYGKRYIKNRLKQFLNNSI